MTTETWVTTETWARKIAETLVILFIVCFLACSVGLSAWLVWNGMGYFGHANEYVESSCLILDYRSVNCVGSEILEWENRCWAQDFCLTANADECDGPHCYGLLYQYNATAKSMCGNISLISTAWEERCEYSPTIKEPGTEHTCYILDCDLGEFSWNAPDILLGRWMGVLSIVCAVLIFCCCCVCGCWSMYDSYRK